MGKKKGIDAERQLLHLFFEKGWMAARVAGSGSTSKLSCDLLAGKGRRKYAIECKTCGGKKKYFSRKQVRELNNFATRFGLKPMLAIKFSRKGWFFVKPESLEATRKGLAISSGEAKKKGKSFEEFAR